jgi:hypothetical protein
MDSLRKFEATFEVVHNPAGTGWVVVITKRNGPPERLGGFETEQVARNWIKYKAQTWLGNPEKK